MSTAHQSSELRELLVACSEGISVRKLKGLHIGGTDLFLSQAQELWDNGDLTGITSEGCCRDVCRSSCVAYMNDEFTWVLSEKT